MRLFVAVPLPEGLKTRLGSLAKEIIQEGVKPVETENLHITLKFIGDSDRADEIADRLKKVRFGPFECKARGVGVFPGPGYVRVVWAGVESGGKLESLASQVMEQLCGFGGDERFSPHITIARVKRKIDAGAFIQKHAGEEFGGFAVSKFVLMQSVLQKGGPGYSVVAEFQSG